MAPDHVDFERNPQLAYARILWRLDALDEWRDRTDKRIAGLDDAVRAAHERMDGIVKAEEVATAVADKLRAEKTLQLTVMQKIAAGLVAAVALADGIRGLIS